MRIMHKCSAYANMHVNSLNVIMHNMLSTILYIHIIILMRIMHNMLSIL